MPEARATGPVQAAWSLAAPLRAYTGFAFGSRYPSLLCELGGPELPDRQRQATFAGLRRILAPIALPDGGESDRATLAWLLGLVDSLQQAAGLPVFESARLVEATSQTSLCLIPTCWRSLGPLSSLVQCLLKLLPQLTAGRREARLEGEFVRLHHALKATNYRSSNVPRFIRAAYDLGIGFRELPGQFLQYGDGEHGRWLDSTFTDGTPYISTQLARDKLMSAAILRQAGVPVPNHKRAADLADAQVIAARIGWPVVVKPMDLDGGTGVAADLRDASEVAAAWTAARQHSLNIMVEQHIAGRDYRLTVVRGQMVWAVERIPAGVTGDGAQTIARLVAQANADPRRGEGQHAALKRLMLDEEAVALLAREGLTCASIPAAGQFVRLRRTANVASGGIPVAVFDKVHPDNALLAERAARALRLDLAGIDLLIPDIAVSWRTSGAAICEVNAQPQLGGTTSAHVYPQILRELVGGNGRVATVILCGMVDGDAVAQKLAAALKQRGIHVGLHDAAGVRLGDEWLADGSVSLHAAGTMLANDPRTGAMVLSLAGSDSLRQGLPVPRFDVLVIGPDEAAQTHLALIRPACDGIEIKAAHSEAAALVTQIMALLALVLSAVDGPCAARDNWVLSV